MKETRKILGTLIGILGFIAAMAGLTYAMYVYNTTVTPSGDQITGGHDCEEIISYNKGNDITLESGIALEPVSRYNDSPLLTEITFYATCGTSEGTIYIYTHEYVEQVGAELLENVLKYTIVKNIKSDDSEEIVTEGYITSTGDTAIDVGVLETTETTYKIYLWLEDNGTEITNASYAGYIRVEAKQTSTFKE